MKKKKLKKNNKNLNPHFFNNRTIEQLNSVLLFIFILLLPTQLGKHFFLPFSYLSGIRVDYLAPTVYVTDIIVFLLSILNLELIFNFFRQKKILILLFLLLFSLLLSKSPIISLYRYIKIVELLIVFVIFKKNSLPIKKILLAFLLGACFEFLLAMLQFNFKHSIQGIFYFFGERFFSLSTPGIAKASYYGVEILRPYATFSHPNSLAGFYLLLYFFTITNKKIRPFVLIRNSLLLFSSLLIFLSFSKLAIFTFLLLNLVFLWNSSIKKNCLLCFFSRLIILIVLSLIFFQAKADPLSLQKRYELNKNALSIIEKYPFTGVGIGSYLVIQNKIPTEFPDLLNQPVHNVFLLILVETGFIIGALIFFLFVKDLRRFIKNYAYIFLVILITGFFDHYWLTLEQNFLLLGVVFGLL